MIDYSIRAGDIAVVASLVGSCFYYSYIAGRFSGRIEHMQEDLDDMKEVVKQTSIVLLNLAVQKERLDTQGQRMSIIEKQIEDLRNGRGFITDPSVRGINREY